MNKANTDMSSFQLYKRLLTYGRPFWPAFVVAIIANSAYSGIDSAFAYLLKPLVDKGFVSPDMKFIAIVPLLIMGLFFLRAVSGLIGNYAMTWVGSSVVMVFRRLIFRHMLRLPAFYHDRNSSGQLLSLIVYNTSQVANACTDAVTDFVRSLFLVIGLLAVMFTISWQLSLIYLVMAPFLAYVVRATSKRLRKQNRDVQTTMADITHVAEETIEGYKVVRTFGGEDYETEKFDAVTLDNRKETMRVTVTKSISVSGVQFIGVFALAFMIFVATSPTIFQIEQIGAGGFAAMVTSMMALLRPLKMLSTVNAAIQRGLAGAISIFEMLDSDAEIDQGDQSISRVSGAVEYRHVGFEYREGAPVLTDISFTVKPGECVAFVGKSGSGKSTLVSLLSRFYDVSSGEILIDGVNIKDIPLRDLRNQMALVTQHVTLFNDTLAHNIAYGRLGEASEQDIVDAATAAHAMEFIKDLPEKLQSRVGENGVLLSGGQRQRIAIARAILKNAPILILDEATSALDTESERLIQDALVKVMKNRTTFVIAHRLSTIENADRIFVVDGGEIIEMGNHKELLARNGHYAKLHKMQFTQGEYWQEEADALG